MRAFVFSIVLLVVSCVPFAPAPGVIRQPTTSITMPTTTPTSGILPPSAFQISHVSVLGKACSGQHLYFILRVEIPKSYPAMDYVGVTVSILDKDTRIANVVPVVNQPTLGEKLAEKLVIYILGKAGERLLETTWPVGLLASGGLDVYRDLYRLDAQNVGVYKFGWHLPRTHGDRVEFLFHVDSTNTQAFGVIVQPEADPAGTASLVTTTIPAVCELPTPITPSPASPVSPPTVVQFTDINASLTGVGLSSVAWGDYDNDGNLDILLTGCATAGNCTKRIAKIYRNDGKGGFIDIGAALTGVEQGAAAWGDYDNDGDLDIVLTGWTGSDRISKVYRNNGGGVFTDIGARLIGVRNSSVAWGDFDKDGDLDILLMGCSDSGCWSHVTKVYRNDGAGVFTDIAASLFGGKYASVAWGDYDNDDNLDIALCGDGGLSSQNWRTKVYRNNGNGTFTDINAGLIGVAGCSLSWGDYDNDSNLDILLTGNTGSAAVSKVYRNNGRGMFTDIHAALTAVKDSNGGAAWGDYDGDGDLDILLTGSTGSACVAKVYRNDGGGVFTDTSASLPGVCSGSVAWGDYDNDGDLDILLAGFDGSSVPIAEIYRNNIKK